MEPGSCLEALDAALASSLADPVVARVDWARFLSQRAGGMIPPLLADLAADLPRASSGSRRGARSIRGSP